MSRITPIVLDTDIGTDIDDAYALVLAAVSPELDLRAVTTVNHDTVLRARIAKSLLRCMGRDAVPVAAGARDPLTLGADRGWEGHEGKGIDLSGILPERDVDSRPAPELIAECAAQASAEGAPLTLVAVGALTNVALALRQYPAEMRKVARVVAMASNFCGFGEAAARGEHNVACDPVALQDLFDFGLPVTLVGLNVTHQTAMTRADLDAFAAVGGPLAEAIAGMHRVWFDFIRGAQSPMHDGLAVAAVFRPDLMTMEPVAAAVARDREAMHRGVVVYNAPPPGAVTPVQIATAVDVAGYHRLFFERIMQAARACAAME